MHDVKRRLRLRGETDGFFDAGQAAPGMRVNRRAPPAGDAEHGEQLVTTRRRRVDEPCANADRAAIESLLDAPHNLGDLARGRGLMRARTGRQKRARVAEHRHAYRNVANADAVVDDLTALPLARPPVDVSGPDLELERGRHAVRRAKLVDVGRLAVGVQIDEPGNDDGAGGVDRGASRQSCCGDGGNRPAGDADGSNGIQVRFGIEHTAVHDDDVVGLGRQQHHEHGRQERAEAKRRSLLPGEVAHGRER